MKKFTEFLQKAEMKELDETMKLNSERPWTDSDIENSVGSEFVSGDTFIIISRAGLGFKATTAPNSRVEYVKGTAKQVAEWLNKRDLI